MGYAVGRGVAEGRYLECWWHRRDACATGAMSLQVAYTRMMSQNTTTATTTTTTPD